MAERLKNTLLAVFILLAVSACNAWKDEITPGSLLDEMTDLERLSSAGDIRYRSVQFSSYDRRSVSPSDPGWFANDDGFGGEPVPGFEEILKQPDSTGIGEYLVCDIHGPGVIQRLWTAAITGKIRFYLDDLKIPVYEGNAIDFFREPLEVLAGINDSVGFAESLRQFDATYLPIPFSRGCRIEWIGNINEPHFYHIGVRMYDKGKKVESFNIPAFREYIHKLSRINGTLSNPESLNESETEIITNSEEEIDAGETREILCLKQSGAISLFRIKVCAKNLESTLRKSILSIYFDDSAIPQVHAPVGDFFGAAPGLNPYQSLAFSVFPDSIMVCRFIMPFRDSVRIEIRNRSDEKIKLTTGIRAGEFKWKEGESMHFRARWKMAHELMAGNTDTGIYDMKYLDVTGTGRIVGAATFIYNPSPVPTSWGNWWGEGDEKIFVDNDSFPSFFGTGSEDYYNYSWSSPEIFSYAYCGQPRNDGPGNRGYVSNFRWHIADDIPFRKNLNFNMELRHHGIVPGFSYGSIVYFYALPASADDFKKIEESDIRDLAYTEWSPLAYLGCAGFNFIQAENLVEENLNLTVEKGNIWAEESILSWTPKHASERLVFHIRSDRQREKARIGLTLAHCPGGGTISFILNGKPVKFGANGNINLDMPHRTVLDNHFSEPVDLKMGENELVIEMPGADGPGRALIDFVWLQK